MNLPPNKMENLDKSEPLSKEIKYNDDFKRRGTQKGFFLMKVIYIHQVITLISSTCKVCICRSAYPYERCIFLLINKVVYFL